VVELEVVVDADRTEVDVEADELPDHRVAYSVAVVFEWREEGSQSS